VAPLREQKTGSYINDVWVAWVPSDNVAARATVEARLASPSVEAQIMV
jgi:hypothetical protein